MHSPWVTRALRGQLPASDRTGRITVERLEEWWPRSGRLSRVDTGAGTHSIADLQRAMAREDAGR